MQKVHVWRVALRLSADGGGTEWGQNGSAQKEAGGGRVSKISRKPDEANGGKSRCRARTSVQRRSQKAEVSRDQHLSTDRDQGLEPQLPAVPLPSLACFYPDITARSFLLLSALLSVGIIGRGRGAAAGTWKHVSFRSPA